ncbi:uncharacterized protein [Triticum aestivum]|uniref:uncharacterized protein n=1 Tax=Triticum aestivum TaxID=4565 RepID=UPI001D0295A9|nr:uncharacterized protein LOC123078291 [Triticum aestivum]
MPAGEGQQGPVGGGATDPVGIRLERPQEENCPDPPRLHARVPPRLLSVLDPSSLGAASCKNATMAAAHGGPPPDSFAAALDPFTPTSLWICGDELRRRDPVRSSTTSCERGTNRSAGVPVDPSSTPTWASLHRRLQLPRSRGPPGTSIGPGAQQAQHRRLTSPRAAPTPSPPSVSK